MGTIKTTNIEPIANNGTVTLGSSGDTFTVPSGVTVNMSSATQTGVGGNLTPAWFVKSSSAQSISDDTATKVTLDTEVFDTDSAFASNKFTVPSGEAGKYFIYGSIDFINTSNNDMRENYIMFYKNGSATILHALNGYTNANMRRLVLSTSVTLDLAVGDYLEMYGTADTAGGSSSEMRSNNSATYFGGFKLLI